MRLEFHVFYLTIQQVTNVNRCTFLRRKGRSVSETFVRYEDAKQWATDSERQIDRGDAPTTSRVRNLKTFGDLIELHIADTSEVGKAPRPNASPDPLPASLSRTGG